MSGGVKNHKKRYLLILSCSKRKKLVSKAPALELYDGPFYRVLRKNMPPNLDVLVLSAKYGLINSDKIISHYDQMMTVEKAEELVDEVKTKLENFLKNNNYNKIFINLSGIYLIALKKSEELLDKNNVYWAKGQIGERLHQLKSWLADINKERD